MEMDMGLILMAAMIVLVGLGGLISGFFYNKYEIKKKQMEYDHVHQLERDQAKRIKEQNAAELEKLNKQTQMWYMEEKVIQAKKEPIIYKCEYCDSIIHEGIRCSNCGGNLNIIKKGPDTDYNINGVNQVDIPKFNDTFIARPYGNKGFKWTNLFR